MAREERVVTPTLLSNGSGCHEAIPVDAIVDEFTFGRFITLSRLVENATFQVGLPMRKAMPHALATMAHKLKHGGEMAASALVEPISGLISDWEKIALPQIDEPEIVEVDDVDSLITTGTITTGSGTHSVDLLPAVSAQLRAGQPVTTKLTIGDMLVPVRIVPKPRDTHELPLEVSVPQATLDAMIDERKLVVLGAGEIDLMLTKPDIENLRKRGLAQVYPVTRSGEPAPKPILLKVRPVEIEARSNRAFTGGFSYSPTGYAEPDDNPSDITIDGNGLTAAPVLPALPMVLYLTYKQTWTLRGYTRGELLNTFALAPQEDLTIEVFSWDRRRLETEDTTSMENEVTGEAGFNTKTTFDCLREAKKSNGWNFGINGGITIPKANVNLGSDYATRESFENLSRNTTQYIEEATFKAATKIKASRQTKVTEAQEFGREDRVTRRIRNPNMGRVLHIDCFEVLAHYTVTTALDLASTKLCVLVPVWDFVGEQVYGHLSFLVALESILFDKVPKALQNGFAASRKILAQGHVCYYKCVQSCPCDTKPTSGNSGGTTPSAGNSTDPALTELNAAITQLKAATQTLREASGVELAGYLGPFGTRVLDTVFRAAEQKFRGWLYRRLIMEGVITPGVASRFWNNCLKFEASQNAGAAELQALIDSTPPQIVDVLNGAIAFALNSFTMMPTIVTLVGELAVQLGNPLLPPFFMGHLGFDDLGLDIAFKRAQNALNNYRNAAQAPTQTAGAVGASEGRSQESNATNPSLAIGDYSPEQMAEATMQAWALREYILLNKSLYRSIIWNALDPEDRLRMLNLFERLPDYVLPNVLGFVGDRLAIEFNLDSDASAHAWFEENVLNNNQLANTSRLQNKTLLTPGVSMEARLGVCDTLEPFLVKSREVELRRLEAVATQQEAEARRMTQRINTGVLDDPNPALPPLRVQLENTP